MLNCDDPEVFEKYDYKVIPGGCRTIDPATGEYEDSFCANCYGGYPGYCEWYPKAKKMATALKLKKAMDELSTLSRRG